MIVYDYLKKIHYNKAVKNKKKKYLRRGKVMAHAHVFKKILCDIGSKIVKNLRYRTYQTAQKRNKQHGQHKTLCIKLDKETWDTSGCNILKYECGNMERNGMYLYFTNIIDQVETFGQELKEHSLQKM
eukprot:72383_1